MLGSLAVARARYAGMFIGAGRRGVPLYVYNFRCIEGSMTSLKSVRLLSVVLFRTDSSPSIEGPTNGHTIIIWWLANPFSARYPLGACDLLHWRTIRTTRGPRVARTRHVEASHCRVAALRPFLRRVIYVLKRDRLKSLETATRIIWPSNCVCSNHMFSCTSEWFFNFLIAVFCTVYGRNIKCAMCLSTSSLYTMSSI